MRANWLVRLFINPEKLAEANRKYQNRMQEIREQDAEVRFQIELAKARNKRDFLAELDRNDEKRNQKLAKLDAKERELV